MSQLLKGGILKLYSSQHSSSFQPNITSFLKDVLVCSLGAYGGPEAHMSVFLDQMVTKKQYLNEEELIELIALCSILPGPTSTQAIVSIGYKIGGPKLAFMTLLVWALPVLLMMTLLSFLYPHLSFIGGGANNFRFIGPMAVGFIIVAAYRISKKVLKGPLTYSLFIMAATITYFIRSPWIFPLVLIIGGLISTVFSKEKNLWHKTAIKPPWIYLIVFSLFALLGLFSRLVEVPILLDLFESFYRYGYLVFGGGQVVVPVMYSELVEVSKHLTHEEFLTGYGLVQGLPGPMFSFSAFAGGMAAAPYGYFYQLLGALLSGISIFLPGILLIFFVYPVWENLKKIRGIQVSLTGINAVAGGLISIAAIILFRQSGLSIENMIISTLTIVLLATKKIPAPLLVLSVLVVGFIL